MINPDFAFNAMRLLDSKVNDIFVSRFSYFFICSSLISLVFYQLWSSSSLCFGASNEWI